MNILLLKQNIYTYIHHCPAGVLNQIDTALAPFQKGYFFSTKYKLGQWDGRVHMLNKRFESIPTGLIDRVIRIICKAGLDFSIDDRRIFPGSQMTLLEDLTLKGVTLRTYQKAAIKRCLIKERGILDLATNAGKTEIAIGLMKALNLKTLLLTHRKELLYQTSERIKERIGWRVDRVGDSLDESGNEATVAMVQSLSKLDIRELKEKLKDFHLLICDETHHSGSALKTYYRIGMHCPAYWRIGLSGTPYTKDEVKDLRMIGMLGPTIMKVSNADLVEGGFSAKPEITMTKIDQSRLAGLNYPDSYLQGIVHNQERNEKIYRTASELDLPTLIIIQHIEHGKNLKRLFSSNHCEFIWGEQSSEERQRALKDFKKGKVKYLISSVILDEGIDLPSIRHLILGAGGKSSIRTIQRLGRALRIDEGKDKVYISDFLDVGNQYLQAHARRRKKDCEKEGFSVAIV